ncbi:hypothetical protein HK096_003971, partial [Nowakowskiella sp. JEL0078]
MLLIGSSSLAVSKIVQCGQHHNFLQCHGWTHCDMFGNTKIAMWHSILATNPPHCTSRFFGNVRQDGGNQNFTNEHCCKLLELVRMQVENGKTADNGLKKRSMDSNSQG